VNFTASIFTVGAAQRSAPPEVSAMKSSFHFFIISIVTIALGAGWLLNLFPNINNIHWVWPMGMGLAGLLILALCGVNKLTIVTGPLLIVAAIFTVMRQVGRFEMSQEMPSLVIAMGLLMLVSVLAPIPAPGWAKAERK
jgi:hypothetical protein